MTPIEWIAGIVVIFAVIKIIFLAFNPMIWMRFAKRIWSKPKVVQLIAIILSGIVLYYLIQSGLNIVQIMATTAFVILLLMIGLAEEVDELIKKYNNRIKNKKLWKQFWLYTLLWIILLSWTIKHLWF